MVQGTRMLVPAGRMGADRPPEYCTRTMLLQQQHFLRLSTLILLQSIEIHTGRDLVTFVVEAVPLTV